VPSALVLQTQDNCPPGLLCEWAGSRGISLDVLRVDRWADLPDPGEYAFAIALGSDASLAGRPPEWVANELDWIRRAVGAGVPVLGICFGAQALAVALGGSVERLPAPENAWIEVDTDDPVRIPPGPWLALHQDGITPPPLAYELARNRTGAQAFSIGRHLGVQFHPEATPPILRGWIDDKADSLGVARERLLTQARELRRAAAAAALALFESFAAQALPVRT
jgi:GMP synthase-like glutamine amidotransferase